MFDGIMDMIGMSCVTTAVCYGAMIGLLIAVIVQFLSEIEP